MIKIIVSGSYGSFEPNKEYKDLLNKKGYSGWWDLKARTDKDIIEFVERSCRPEYEISQIGENDWQYVSVVEVDNTIPWTIDEYDGAEGIQYIKYTVIDKELNYCQFDRD